MSDVRLLAVETPRRRVLIAEDEALIRLDLAEMLDEAGYEVVAQAANGEEAVELAREHRPDLVITDVKMPKVDGLEVLRRVKQDPKLRHIPVVMLTSSSEERDLVESYSLGVNAYVVKPVDFGQFVEAVRKTGVFWAVLNNVPHGGASVRA